MVDKKGALLRGCCLIFSSSNELLQVYFHIDTDIFGLLTGIIASCLKCRNSHE